MGVKTLIEREREIYMYAASPLYLLVLHPWIQPNTDRKYSEKKSQKVPKKQNLNLPCTSNYLHSTYIVLGIISNLEMF